MKKVVSLLLIAAILIGMAAMAGAVVMPTAVILWGNNPIYVGRTSTYWADVLPTNAWNHVEFYSSDPSVVTIDKHSGRATALRSGRVTLSVVTDNGLTDKKTFTVYANEENKPSNSWIPVADIRTEGATTIQVGQTVQWGASVLPSNASNKTIHWSSGYPAVATVDQYGNVTGHRTGQAHITMTAANNVKKTLTVTVVGNGSFESASSYSSTPVTGIQTAGATTIQVGQTVRWTASVLPTNASSKSLTWASGYPAVATVDQNGYITGHRAGKAHITVYAANGVYKTLTMTVVGSDSSGSVPSSGSVAVTGIQTAGATTIQVGQSVKWTASVQPSNASNKSLTWTSGYPAVATVDQNGNITGHRAGQAHITITAANGVKKRLTLTVQEKQAEVKVPLTSLTSIDDKMHNYTQPDSVCTDNYGNRYSRAYVMQGYAINKRTLQYLTSGQYRFFEATFYVVQDSRMDYYGNMTIIGDGVTLYTSPTLYKDSKPVYVKVNVAGYNNIQIVLTRGGGAAYIFATGLANASFVK